MHKCYNCTKNAEMLAER